VLVLVYALSALEIHWTAPRVVVLLASIPAGVLIFSAVWVVFASLAFWTTDSGEFTNAFTNGGNFLAPYPIDIYGAWLRRLLAYLIPLAFVCYFPALYVLGKQDPLGLPRVLQFLSPAVALAVAVVAGCVWRFAVRHYRSAGG
jgi:ABC-2 type transport system permease protein